MKLPVYLIDIDLFDDATGMGAISFVTDPAIESNFICFEKETKPMMFKVENEMEHKVTGCAIWCDKPIYRYSPDLGEYYVVFNKETIDKIVHKYAKQGLNNLVDLQHDGEMIDGVVMVEYFIKDTEKGINPKGFEDITDGSLFVTYKIEDEKLWNEIIAPDSEFKGFSIEINADIVPTNDYVEEETTDEDEEFMNWLEELIKALEDADCEVIFEDEKKKFELSDDEDEDDGLWSLNFEVERTDITRLIDSKKSAIIDGREYWVQGIGKDGGKDVAVLYDPKATKYVVKPLSNIKEFEPTNTSVGNFPPLPKDIVDNDDITIQKTVNSNDIGSILHNRITCMVQYNDEQPNPATGYRQIAVVAWGVTTAGNECIRCYELFGDSRSGEVPDYKLMLTKRIRTLKPMWNTQPWGKEILDSRYNWGGDDSMVTVFEHITETDFMTND